MKDVECYCSGDYAGIKLDDVEMYYGYEFQYIVGMDAEDDDNNDVETWGFVIQKAEKIIFSADAKEIGGDKWECQEMLMKGMLLAMQKGVLSVTSDVSK